MSNMINIDRAMAIDGWMSPTELKWLGACALRFNEIIEVGCYKGRSTRALCDNTLGIVLAVDPYKGAYYYDDFLTKVFDADEHLKNEFYTNLRDHLDSGRLIHYRTTLKELPTEIKSDFIFIDGDHHYDEVMSDLSESLKRIKKGGIIAGHDYGRPDWPGVEKAVKEVFGQTELIDTIWWVQK